jgi:hypothetical protein
MYNPIAVLLTAALGWAVCTALRLPAHLSDLAAAAVAALVSAEAAVVPLVLARRGGQAAVVQAALIGTLLHMFLLAALAAGGYLVTRLGPGFLYWVLAFYWPTLIALVAAFAKSIRAAPPTLAPPRAG